MSLEDLGSSYKVYRNNELNLDTNTSCKGQENSGGYLFNGISVSKQNGVPKVNQAFCGSITAKKDLENIPINTEFNNTCQCEFKAVINGDTTCPKDKFIKAYYPQNNKISCCSSCLNDGHVIAGNSDKSGHCVTQYIQLSDKTADLKCPPNTFMKSMTMTDNTANITCCYPILSGPYAVEQGLELNQCDALGIPALLCTANKIKEYNNYCKKYGLSVCNQESINQFYKDCDNHNYLYQNVDNETKNPNSVKECHYTLVNQSPSLIYVYWRYFITSYYMLISVIFLIIAIIGMIIYYIQNKKSIGNVYDK